MTTADDTSMMMDDSRLAMQGTIEAIASGVGSEPVVVNLGPQHPSTHGGVPAQGDARRRDRA